LGGHQAISVNAQSFAAFNTLHASAQQPVHATANFLEGSKTPVDSLSVLPTPLAQVYAVGNVFVGPTAQEIASNTNRRRMDHSGCTQEAFHRDSLIVFNSGKPNWQT
jgi:hypothetical protein